MTSRLGVLYDVAAAQQRVTSLFGGVGGLHIAPPGTATHWRFGPRDATCDVTVTGRGVTHCTTWKRAVYRTMGRVLHTVSADGCEKLVRRAQQRVTSLLGGVLHIAQP